MFEHVQQLHLTSLSGYGFRYTPSMPPFNEFTAWVSHSFRLSRRELVRALVGLVTWFPASVLLAAPRNEPARPEFLRALGPFLDTLLPEEGSPSATALGVDEEIIRLMRSNEHIARVVVLGCGWLDQQAVTLGSEEFARLDPAQQESIVASAEQSAPRSLPGAFFSGMLDLAYRHYYARPESWPDLGYAGPPQPRGFMDFTQAPAKTPVKASANAPARVAE